MTSPIFSFRIFLLVLALWHVPVWGNPMGSLFAPQARQVSSLSFEASHSISGEPSQREYFLSSLSSRLVLENQPDSLWALSLEGQRTHLPTTGLLPGTGSPSPKVWWKSSLGVSHMKTLAGGLQLGGLLQMGSPSDRPFEALDTLSLGLTGVLRFPSQTSNYWMLFLNYSNNRAFLNHIPLPGFGYLYQPSPKWSMLLGVPFFSIFASPLPKVLFQFLYLIPWRLETSLRYFFLGPVQLFTSFEMGPEVFLRHGREERSHRVMVDAKTWKMGLQSPLGQGWSVGTYYAYVFSRRVFESRKYSDTSKGVLLLGAQSHLQINVTKKF